MAARRGDAAVELQPSAAVVDEHLPGHTRAESPRLRAVVAHDLHAGNVRGRVPQRRSDPGVADLGRRHEQQVHRRRRGGMRQQA
jgi:hypothetical protein